jgi:hypothetical protein
MADRKVSIVLKATDEASKVFENVANNTLPQFAKRVAQSLTAFASVAAIEETLRRAVGMALDAEKATAALAAALDSQKISVAANLPHLTAMAGALSRVTAADDEAVQGAQKLLISIGGLTGDKLDQATKAALNLAAGLGIALPEAAEKVARAAAGSTKAFSQLGVKFSDTATDAQKLDTVLGFIERRWGGAAQAEVETMAGKLGLMAKAFGELLEASAKGATGTGPKEAVGTITQALNAITSRVEEKGLGNAIMSIIPLPGDPIWTSVNKLNDLFDKMERLRMDDAVMLALSGKFAKEADPVLEQYKKDLDAIIKGQADAADEAKRWADQLEKIKRDIDFQVFAPQKKSPKTPITGSGSDDVIKHIVSGAEFDQDQFDKRAAAAKQEQEDWQTMMGLIAQYDGGLVQFGETIEVVSNDTNKWAIEFEKQMFGNIANAAAELGGALFDALFRAKKPWGEWSNQSKKALATAEMDGVAIGETMDDAASEADESWDKAIEMFIARLIEDLIVTVMKKALLAALGPWGLIVGIAIDIARIAVGFEVGGIVGDPAYAAAGMMAPGHFSPSVVPDGLSQSIRGGRASLVAMRDFAPVDDLRIEIHAMDPRSISELLVQKPRLTEQIVQMARDALNGRAA